MNLLYANPFVLGLQYLLLMFTGTPTEKLLDQFYEGVNNNVRGASNSAQEQTYDFVVVGGGSTGAVVASRLSENRNFSVLLIEAGSFPFPLTVVPALGLSPGILFNPRMNWQDKTEPQRYAHLSKNPTLSTYRRPKVVGGGSVLNYMLSMRGSPKDYDRWANVTEDPSWTYENLLPYFKKSENYNGPYKSERYHSTTGPMSIELKPHFVPLTKEYFAAAKQLGYDQVDPNAHQTEGVYRYATSTKNGRRWSTNDGYIWPAILRPNFQIEINSEVTQILLSPNNQVEGVVYTKRNQTYTVRVRKEVVVSSGAVGSPKLLLLSGIGPKEHLKSVGIPVKVDLPAVGQNLQDHVAVLFGPFVFNKTKSSCAELHQADENPLKSAQDFVSDGIGTLSHTGTSVAGHFRSSLAELGHPDLAILPMLLPVILGDETSAIVEHLVDIRPGLTQQYMKDDHGRDAFFLLVCSALPKSRGEVKLWSKNPLDFAIIDPKHLTHEQDLKTVVEGMKLALKLVKTEAYKNIDARLISTPFSGCEAHAADLQGEDYLACYAKRLASSQLHYASTCAMGKGPDPDSNDTPTSVVDSKLRVHGVKGLRIADSSVMPYIVNANTNVPCIMIGEKVADDIKRVWSDQ